VFLTREGRGSYRRRVSDDWISALPRDKSQMFDAIVARWESAYAMMSVSLDNSLSLRAGGELVCARQQVGVTAVLFDRIASSLISFCDIVDRQSRLLPSCPVVEPLNSEFFRGITGQHAASWNGFLHRILFGDRSRFHHKVRILSDTLRQLDREFRKAAEAVSDGISGEPAIAWNALDCIHYDFNTCLRENEILLKSFLRALPAQHLEAFSTSMNVPGASKAMGVLTQPFGASA
jgi:hypothetical protein